MAKASANPSPISRILLATDLSCRCDRAFARACALASAWRAKLTVVAAVEDPFDEPSWRSKRATMAERVNAELGPELNASGIEWDVVVAPGPPAEVVVATAEERQSQLIVTGVARNELLGRARPGRTVEALLRDAPAPVLTVKRRGLAPYRLVLVPTDFTEAAESAFVRAAALFPEARFVLLHGYHVTFPVFLGEEGLAARFREDALERQELFAQRLKARLHGQGLPETLIEYGLPEVLAADFEQAEKPDLVVIGAHDAHDWMANEVTGAAPKIISAVHCDVLLFPATAKR